MFLMILFNCSAISKPHASYNVGDYVNLQLMCREKGSLNVTKASKPKAANFPHLFGDEDEIMHSKLILADPDEVSYFNFFLLLILGYKMI